mgnify:CR=1 FL=1
MSNMRRRKLLSAPRNKMVVDDAPVVFFFNRERFLLVKPTVRGLKITSMDGQTTGDFFWPEVFLAK